MTCVIETGAQEDAIHKIATIYQLRDCAGVLLCSLTNCRHFETEYRLFRRCIIVGVTDGDGIADRLNRVKAS